MNSQSSNASDGGETSPRYQALVAAADALYETLSERAEKTERNRRVLEETARDLHAAGLFRMLQPARIGGSELDYVALVDIGESLARACASTSWIVTNLGSHHWMLALFPPQAQTAIWQDDPNVLVASSFVFPAGKATRVDGGYRLSGRWPFSSGVDISAWNMLAAMVSPDDDHAEPEYRMFLVPAAQYEVIDTWHATGLCGTGSNDVTCNDVFVDEHMTLAVRDVAGGPTPGSEMNPSPLYRLPVFALFPLVLSGVALGNAQGALDDFVSSTRSRASRYTGAQIARLQTIQARIGEAAARVSAARRIMRGICLEAMVDAQGGRIPDLDEKVSYRRDGAFAVGLCTEAVDILNEASGASALYVSHAMQRRFRDAHAIAAHIAFNRDIASSAYGRVVLGQDPETPTL